MENLCKVRDIQHAISTFENQFEKKYEVTLNEGMALCSLYEVSNPLMSGEIGKLLGLSYPNTSKVIVSLEKKGFVERVVGAKDKRQMYFSLTGEGKKIIPKLQGNDTKILRLLKEIIEK